MKSIAVDNLLMITKVMSKISHREYDMVIENMLCRSNITESSIAQYK
jgi:hypothetical protein